MGHVGHPKPTSRPKGVPAILSGTPDLQKCLHCPICGEGSQKSPLSSMWRREMQMPPLSYKWRGKF